MCPDIHVFPSFQMANWVNGFNSTSIIRPNISIYHIIFGKCMVKLNKYCFNPLSDYTTKLIPFIGLKIIYMY